MAKDYIPNTDAEFAAWLVNFVKQLTTSKAALNLTDAALATVTGLKDDYMTAVQELADAKAVYDAKLAAKNQAEKAATAEARSRVRQIQADPGVSDEIRAALQIPLRDTTPTPPPPLTSRPLLTIDFSQRLQHTLEYRDSETPNRRARPANADRIEFYSFVGATATTDISLFKYLDVDTSTPFVVNYTAADAGKIASYIARWVNDNGEKGPWSETVSATIAG